MHVLTARTGCLHPRRASAPAAVRSSVGHLCWVRGCCSFWSLTFDPESRIPRGTSSSSCHGLPLREREGGKERDSLWWISDWQASRLHYYNVYCSIGHKINVFLFLLSESAIRSPGCSPNAVPLSQACPEVPGRQMQRHSEPVRRGRPLFWQGRQWQGCSSVRYVSVALFRWSLFNPAHCTSFTSSYRGRSCKASVHVSYVNVLNRMNDQEYFIFI